MVKNYADVPEERVGIGKGKVIGAVLAAAVIVALLVCGAVLPKTGGQKSVTVEDHLVIIPSDSIKTDDVHCRLDLVVKNNSDADVNINDLPRIEYNNNEAKPFTYSENKTLVPGSAFGVMYEFDLKRYDKNNIYIADSDVVFDGLSGDALIAWIDEKWEELKAYVAESNQDGASGGSSASAEPSGQSADSNQGRNASTTSGSDKFDVNVDGVEDVAFDMKQINGTVVNNSNRAYDYVQIEFSVYDASGALIGSAMDNCNNLKAGGTWKYEAVTFGLSGEFDHYELEGVSAF